jgi:hypothetical protein
MKFLLLLSYLTYAQSGSGLAGYGTGPGYGDLGFGNTPPTFGGFAMGTKLNTSCRPNSYAYHPEHGFGFFVEKTIASDPSPDTCLFYSIKLKGYPIVKRYGSMSSSSCITSARCEKINNTEGKRIVSIACPPIDLNGQKIIGVYDSQNPNETVEILIRSEVPTAYLDQTKKDRRNQIVRKSAYVTQTIDKKYLVDNALRGEKYPIVDLSDQPYAILTKIAEEDEGIYITSKCDPNAPGPVLPFDYGGMGGMGVPGGGGMGGGMMPPITPPGSNGAR